MGENFDKALAVTQHKTLNGGLKRTNA
jgi:hypothetical protein